MSKKIDDYNLWESFCEKNKAKQWLKSHIIVLQKELQECQDLLYYLEVHTDE